MLFKVIIEFMNRSLSSFIYYIIIFLSIPIAAINGYADYVPGEVLVKYKQKTDVSLVNALKTDSNSKHIREFSNIRVHHIKISSDLTVEQAVRLYNEDPNVEYAEPNYIISLHAMPDDKDFNQLWGLHNQGQTGGMQDADIDVPEAWDITVGSKDVVIAVIDTGIAYTHPDISPNLWKNPGEINCTDGMDNDNNGYIDDCYGWDFVGNDNNPVDYNGHGTHVAGIIAASGNNSEGTSGVMWEAQIMPIRIIGINGSGTTADAVSAIEYADSNGARIINLSWGGNNFSNVLKDTIEASHAIVVCAAGNDANNNDMNPDYPASYTSLNIIAVAASDSNDDLAFFSNYGRTSVDLAAPGIQIFSANPVFNYGPPIIVFEKENFDEGLDLNTMGWKSDSMDSPWRVNAGNGLDGSGSLEDSPDGNYPDDTVSWTGYMTPIPAVKDHLYTLSFEWKGEVENNYDYMDINYSADGITWNWIDYRTGYEEDFISDQSTAFTGVAEMFDSFYFGFGITSDSSINGDGVYLDNISLTRSSIEMGEFNYSSTSGTSMAAPFVSGVAGLILAMNPELTNDQVKNKIINSADKIPSLSHKVMSGGRLNAYNALQADPDSNPCTAGNNGGNTSNCITISSAPGGNDKRGEGCFIATAAYGSVMHPYVKELRSFRDSLLLPHRPGKVLVQLYYEYSPPLADYISDREDLRLLTRIILAPLVLLVVYPYKMLGILSILIIGKLIPRKQKIS